MNTDPDEGSALRKNWDSEVGLLLVIENGFGLSSRLNIGFYLRTAFLAKERIADD